MPEPVRTSRRTFTPNSLCMALTILLGLLALLASAVGDFPAAAVLLTLIVSVAGAFMLGYIIYWLARRNRKAGSLAYALALLVILWILLSATAMHYNYNARHLEPPTQQEASYKDTVTGTSHLDNLELLERSMTGEDVTDELEALNRDQVAAMHAKAADIGDLEAQILLALAAVKERMGDASNQKQAAMRAFEQAGGIEPMGLDDPDIAAERLRLLEQMKQAVQAQKDVFSHQEKQLVQDLRTAKVPETLIDDAVEGWRTGLSHELLYAYLDVENESLTSYGQLITLFSERTDEWRFNSEADQIEIQSDTFYDTYKRLMAQIGRLADQELAMQNQIMQASGE